MFDCRVWVGLGMGMQLIVERRYWEWKERRRVMSPLLYTC